MKFTIVACTVALLPAWVWAQNSPPPAPAASGATAYTPMTQDEQFRHFIGSTFNLESALRATVGAAILQALNTPGEWGQGSQAYAERFANDYAQHMIRQSLLYGVSDLLHEDNRYVPSGLTGAEPRVKYAVESTFLARMPDGHRRLSYSRLSAIVATAFISREWQPRSTSGPEHAGLSMVTVLGAEIGFNIAREFLPKLRHTY